MVRTNVVTLSVIKGIAYRQKLLAGGSGIVILREDSAQPGIASISRKSGEPIPTKNTSKKLFPQKAFEEAIALTAGLPYRRQGGVKLRGDVDFIEEPAVKEETVDEIIVDSADYQKIVEAYTDKNGKLSYELLNKDMIKFAHSSSIVRKMIDNGESIDDIRLYVAGAKFRTITGNKNLTDDQVLIIIELLDEVSPKGVFKEFNSELQRWMMKE